MRSANCPTSFQFHDLASHFLALTARDRFLRFGWVMTDLDIVAYVESLLQSIGNVFVVVEPRPDISGVLHLDFTGGGAEVGLSVSAWARGKGIGSLLLERARRVAAARGVRTLFVRNLNFNTALRHLAHGLGMQVACTPGARPDRLELPAASLAKQRDFLIGNITLADYSLRSQWGRGTPADSSVRELKESVPS
jgi:GNAT superfamily N-acetyltransferase